MLIWLLQMICEALHRRLAGTVEVPDWQRWREGASINDWGRRP